ncbi:MAG: DUF922 domain-containing protein [Dehalococcoidia bacterium]|nr:DUF922 domain-containing protein [Dehalococcoidia bacterium]
MSEHASAAPEPAAEARQRRPDAGTAGEMGQATVAVTPGFFAPSALLETGQEDSGRGIQPTVVRQMLRLQASRGNQYVQRLMRSSWAPPVTSTVLAKPNAPRSASGLVARDQAVEAAPQLHTGTQTPLTQISRETATTAVTLTTGQVQNRTFSVTGDGLRAVGIRLNARGEWGRGGAENIVYTAGAVDEDGIVTSIRITAVLFTELPSWRGLASKPERVRNEWNRMLAALRDHENNHVAIARTHLEELTTSLDGVSEDELPALWSEKMAALQGAQAEYDTATTSGQTEGVTLDLSLEEDETEENVAGPEIEELDEAEAGLQPSIARQPERSRPSSQSQHAGRRQTRVAMQRISRPVPAAPVRLASSGAFVDRQPDAPAPVATTMPGPASQVIPWRSHNVPLDPTVQRRTLEYITSKSGVESATSWAAGFYSLSVEELVKLLFEDGIEEDVIAQAQKDLRAATDTFKEDVEQFKDEFEEMAKRITWEILDNSQEKIEAELEHYGIEEVSPNAPGEGAGGAGPVSGGGGAEGGPGAGPLGFNNPAEVSKMKEAARALAAKRRETDKSGNEARKAREEAQARVKQLPGQALASGEMPAGWLDPAANEWIKALSRDWQRMEREYAALCQEKHAQFPFLAMYSFSEDAASQLETFAAKPQEETAETIMAESRKRLENIETVRAELGDRFNIWKQAHIKQVTRQQMNAKPWQTRVVEDKAKGIEQAESDDKIFWACVAIGLGLLAAVPSGGSTLLAGISTAAAALGATLTVTEALEHLEEYSLEAAANGTDFDKANAISQEEPEFFWLAMDLVAAALDIYGAATAWKALKEAIKAAEASGDLVKLLNTVDEIAPAAARGPIVARAVSQMKGSGAIDNAIEAVGDRFRHGDLNRIREMIKEAATQDWHDAFEQMVQAGKIRPLTAEGLREALKTYKPLRQMKYADYAEELWIGEQVWKSDGIFDPVSGMIFLKPRREGDVAGMVIHEMTHAAQQASGAKEFKFWQEFEAYAAQRKFIRQLEKLAPGYVGQSWDFLKNADDMDIAMHIQQMYGEGFEIPAKLLETAASGPSANAQTKALAAARKVLALPR